VSQTPGVCGGRGVDLCKKSAGEMKVLNSAGSAQNKCRQLLIALKPLFVLNVLHNSINDI